MSRRAAAAHVAAAIASLALIASSWLPHAPWSPTEVLGFVTGGWCVWLIVRDNIWNWPIGIANSVFYLVLFWQAHLFADSVLQVFYIVTGFAGWYLWLHGGEAQSRLDIRRARIAELALVVAAVWLATWGGSVYLAHVGDSAPALDAFTTALSLGAQYLLMRKFIENWYLWILADVVYVGLYAWRGLYLTGLLYGVLLAMCLVGVAQWQKALEGARLAPDVTPARLAEEHLDA